MDILGIGVIVACGAMIMNGDGNALLEFGQKALGSLGDLVNGLFGNGQTQEQEAASITPEKLDELSSGFASMYDVQKDGEKLSYEDEKSYFAEMINSELENNQYNITNIDEQNKLVGNVMNQLIDNDDIQIGNLSNVIGIGDDVMSAYAEVGTEDEDLLKEKIADRIEDSINVYNIENDENLVTPEQKNEIIDVVDKNFSLGENPFDQISRISEGLKEKEWFPQKTAEESEISIEDNRKMKENIADMYQKSPTERIESVEQSFYDLANEFGIDMSDTGKTEVDKSKNNQDVER